MGRRRWLGSSEGRVQYHNTYDTLEFSLVSVVGYDDGLPPFFIILFDTIWDFADGLVCAFQLVG